MYTVHHIDIKRIEQLKYTTNQQVVEFSGADMRNKTKELMDEFLATTNVKRNSLAEDLLPSIYFDYKIRRNFKII